MSWLQPSQFLDPISAWVPSLYRGNLVGRTDAPDLVGVNNGTLSGGVSYLSSDGAGGKWCWDLDGIDGHVKVATQGGNPPSGVGDTRLFTVGAWFNTTHEFAGMQYLYSEGWVISQPIFGLGATSGNVGRFFFRDQNSVSASLTGTTIINDGEWHHLLAVGDGTNARLYLDGALEVADTLLPPGEQTVALANIGVLGRNTFSNYWPGLIDDVRVWDRPLVTGEIIELWSGGRGYVRPWVPLGGEVGVWAPTISGDNDAGDLV